MNVPLSWLKDYVDIDLGLEEIAHLLTMTGLEVDEIKVVGLPMPANPGSETKTGENASGSKHCQFKITGLSWEPDKIVVAEIREVMPHPNADRLVLCRLFDGQQEQVVLTGASNLFSYKGQGPLPKPLKVAYAKEGARIYDGHQPGQVITTLKRAKIRGIDSFSMVCSEKELGISDEHEGIIILDDDAIAGIPLVAYMGDAVFIISILPNIVRATCVLGVAREIAAVTGKTLRSPTRQIKADGPSVNGKVTIQIVVPELNPRFVFGLVQGAEPSPSPYWVQRRLRLAGMRPINSIVDATNYVMLEWGEPLHAFDYDLLVQRAGGKAPTIITRPAAQGEHLTTLDGVDRVLDNFTIMVTDTAGPLSIAGIMGGLESEVTEKTRNVLLEGASWNFVNVRKTVTAQRLNSEAAYRFARGVHPALAEEGVLLGMERISQWSGGQIAAGLVDAYPLPPHDPVVSITTAQVRRLLGIDLTAQQIADLLSRLEFACRVEGETVHAKTPPHRLDIGDAVIGQADLCEEIARLYGYNNIPETRLADELPEQLRNVRLENEEHLRDVLVALGLQELITTRMTSPEREARLQPSGKPVEDQLYVRLLNIITQERTVMRRSLLASVLDVLERNVRIAERLALFEIGPIFLPGLDSEPPDEIPHLVIAMSGKSQLSAWDRPASTPLDFYDLKGVLESLLETVHINNVAIEPAEDPIFHPGKAARLKLGDSILGKFGELHPVIKARYDFLGHPVLAAELNLDIMLAAIPERVETHSVPAFPPVLEDIAVIVDEQVPAGRVEEVIQRAGGNLLSDLRLFDIFRGEQIGTEKKSLAYSLTYQAPDRTLTDGEAAQVRNHIVRSLEQELGAKLRS